MLFVWWWEGVFWPWHNYSLQFFNPLSHVNNLSGLFVLRRLLLMKTWHRWTFQNMKKKSNEDRKRSRLEEELNDCKTSWRKRQQQALQTPSKGAVNSGSQPPCPARAARKYLTNTANQKFTRWLRLVVLFDCFLSLLSTTCGRNVVRTLKNEDNRSCSFPQK